MSFKILPVLCAIALATPTGVAAEGDAAIAEHITGNSFEMRRMGMRMQMTFLEGGTLSMQGPMGERSGSWSLSGTELCLTTPRGDQCGTVSVAANGGLTMGNGQTLNPAN
ncbi:hypothetical protein [Tateyamaria omphalii]|nr:hypothetical protein [Tateyamaria omphalii]